MRISDWSSDVCSSDLSGRTKPDAFHGFHMVAYPLRPTSRGEINIESTDVNAMPVLKPNHHATAHDRELMIAIVRSARQYAEQPALRDLTEIENYPRPDCRSEDEMIAETDSRGRYGYHTVLSCRMGREQRR